MTPGMVDGLLEFHQNELRRTFGQVAAAAANVMRTSHLMDAYDFFPGDRPQQSGAQQMEILKKQ